MKHKRTGVQIQPPKLTTYVRVDPPEKWTLDIWHEVRRSLHAAASLMDKQLGMWSIRPVVGDEDPAWYAVEVELLPYDAGPLMAFVVSNASAFDGVIH